MKNMGKELDLPSIIMVTATSIGLGLLAIYPEVHRNWKLVMLLAPIGLGLVIIVLVRRVDRVREVAEKARRWLIASAVVVLAGVITSWLSRLPIIAEFPLGIVIVGAVVFGGVIAFVGFWLGFRPEGARLPVSPPSVGTPQLPHELDQVGLRLTWLGMIEDRVAPGPTGSSPDGHPDGTFLLEGILARGGWVKRILLESVNVHEQLTGLHWWRPPIGNIWILGAAVPREGEWDYLYTRRFEMPAGEPFTLRVYASDDVTGDRRIFTIGSRFRLTIIFEDGHLEGVTCQVERTRSLKK